MAISVLPFVIVQLPQLLNSTSGRHLSVLIALVVSVSLFVSYCLYQVRTNQVFLLFMGILLASEGCLLLYIPFKIQIKKLIGSMCT